MAPSRQKLENKVRFAFEHLTHSARQAGEQISRPDFAREHIDAADRVGQWVAFFFSPVLVIVGFQIIVVFNQLMTQTFGAQPLGSAQQTDIFSWLITVLTGGAYIAMVWTTFLFVRSGGFGWFTWRDV